MPCSHILDDLQESWVAPTFWLWFSSWTAATTAYTASKSRAEESCRRRGSREVNTWSIFRHTRRHPHTHTSGCKNTKYTERKCNVSAVSGQWGVNTSLEWHWDYSIRSLVRLRSADSVETNWLSLSLRLCPLCSCSPLTLAHPDYSNYLLPLSVRAREPVTGAASLSSPPVQTASSSPPLLHPARCIWLKRIMHQARR